MKSRTPVHNYRRQSRLAIGRSLLISAVLLASGFFGGVTVERFFLDTDFDSAFPDLEAVHRIIGENYYYQPTSDEGQAEMQAEMEAGAITGALNTLDDSYTRYLDPEDSQVAQDTLEGKYGGIGVDVSIDHGLVFVRSVVPDSPADRIGIVRGDLIEQVNGERPPVEDRNAVLLMLRGEIGDKVRITVIRPTTGDLIQAELILEEIIIPPVALEYLEDGRIAWIRITQFASNTPEQLDLVLAEVRQSGAQGIVLDLRGNGGGLVDAATHTLGRFLDTDVGPAMFEDTDPGEGGLNELPIQTSEGVTPIELPMVVLVDGSTASASEIVAGALKDYRRAIIVGETTFGKGSVQRVFRFSNNSTIRVTVAEWFTPSRGRIQEEGIRPDIYVSAADGSSGNDPILETGVQILVGILTYPAGDEATPIASPIP